MEISLIKPDDWHLHLRDDAMLKMALPWSSACFRRAIVMPNLNPPVSSVEACRAYRERILAVAQDDFEPLMTLYLTEDMSAQTIVDAQQSHFIYGVKMYPRNATTHSAAGVQTVEKIFPVLEKMQELDMPLLVHGESMQDGIDIFDREKVFIDKVLSVLRAQFSQLRIVLEHITTEDAVAYVRDSNHYTAATITPHHLLYSRNALFEGGLRPHRYCLPLPQREQHRKALVDAATSGAACFFGGTDSAPHLREDKESDCGCAGVFNAPIALPLYASIFDDAGKLENLEKFVSLNGAMFYRLENNTQRIHLVKEDYVVPDHISDGQQTVIPLLAGQTIPWRIQN